MRTNYINVGLKNILTLIELSEKAIDTESKDIGFKGIKDITKDLIKTINEERI
mgnify:FL=1|jgi:hypothetical protein